MLILPCLFCVGNTVTVRDSNEINAEAQRLQDASRRPPRVHHRVIQSEGARGLEARTDNIQIPPPLEPFPLSQKQNKCAGLTERTTSFDDGLSLITSDPSLQMRVPVPPTSPSGGSRTSTTSLPVKTSTLRSESTLLNTFCTRLCSRGCDRFEFQRPRHGELYCRATRNTFTAKQYYEPHTTRVRQLFKSEKSIDWTTTRA